ncbi:unnamed protein product, partial [marine sediment metagenome]
VQQIIEAEYRVIIEPEPGASATGIVMAGPPVEGNSIDPTWLEETLKGIKWSEDTAKTWVASQFGVAAEGKLTDVLSRLTREQAEQFVKHIQEKADQNQASLL